MSTKTRRMPIERYTLRLKRFMKEAGGLSFQAALKAALELPPDNQLNWAALQLAKSAFELEFDWSTVFFHLTGKRLSDSEEPLPKQTVREYERYRRFLLVYGSPPTAELEFALGCC